MIKSNYQLVFTLRVAHTYFEKNICSCLRFNPGVKTQALIKRFGIVKRDFENGFSLYANLRSLTAELLSYITASAGDTSFDFDVKTTTPSFYYFTQLPSQSLGRLIYDSGSALNIAANESTELVPSFVTANVTKNLGSLTIHFDDLVKATNGKQFNISYMARSTQWQYYIINRSAVHLNSPAISGKTNIVFDGPQNTALESGEQALLFTSGQQLIPLSKVPKYKFDLVNNPVQAANQKSASASIIFRGLPNPDPTRMGIMEAGGNMLAVSPMYIYV